MQYDISTLFNRANHEIRGHYIRLTTINQRGDVRSQHFALSLSAISPFQVLYSLRKVRGTHERRAITNKFQTVNIIHLILHIFCTMNNVQIRLSQIITH